jgi:hypothetical protein
VAVVSTQDSAALSGFSGAKCEWMWMWQRLLAVGEEVRERGRGE